MLPLLLALAVSGAPATTRAQAEGTVTLEGHAITLTHAYARVDEDGNVEVALLDRALPEEALDPEIKLDRAARMGKAWGLQFTLVGKGASRWSVSTEWGGDGCGGYCAPELVFEPATRTDALVSGRALTHGTAHIAERKVQFEIRFAAEVRRFVEPKAANVGQEADRRRIHEKGYAFSKRDYVRAAAEAPDFFDTFVRAGMPVDVENPYTGSSLLIDTLDRLQECDDAETTRLIGVLVALKADPNQAEEDNGHRETALEKAYPCAVPLGLLLAAGAKLDAPAGGSMRPSTTGRELMGKAIADGDAEVVDLLIRSGFDVKPDGAALLKTAAGKPDVVKLLRAAGAKAAAAAPAGPKKPR